MLFLWSAAMVSFNVSSGTRLKTSLGDWYHWDEEEKNLYILGMSDGPGYRASVLAINHKECLCASVFVFDGPRYQASILEINSQRLHLCISAPFMPDHHIS